MIRTVFEKVTLKVTETNPDSETKFFLLFSTVLFRLLPSHVTSSRLQFVFLGSEQQTLVFSNGVTKGGVSIGDNCKFISLSVIISFAFSKHSAARLLAKNPQKVVTDDPTCFVDYKATFEILECTQCHVGTSAINKQ